jgi:hypothetical protein
MAKFLVTYDLIKDKDYKLLIGELERLDAHKALLSVWLVELNNTTAHVRDHLAGFIDEDDKLFVAEMTVKPSFTKAFKGTSAWLDARF